MNLSVLKTAKSWKWLPAEVIIMSFEITVSLEILPQ